MSTNWRGSFARIDVARAQGMLAPAPECNKPIRRGQRSNRALAQKADQEYARFMDEMNQASRKRGGAMSTSLVTLVAIRQGRLGYSLAEEGALVAWLLL